MPSIGDINVSYYDFSTLTAFPAEGLSSLTAISTGSVTTINFPSTSGNFANSGLSNNVAALFEGYLTIPEDTKQICVRNDNESRLVFEDSTGSRTLVIDNDGEIDNGGDFVDSRKCFANCLGGFFPCTFAGTVSFELEYFEKDDTAGLILEWGDGQDNYTPISAEYFVLAPSAVPSMTPSTSEVPSALPSLSVVPSVVPSLTPSDVPSSMPSIGDIKVSYYDFSNLTALPAAGVLSSYTAISTGSVTTINFPSTSGNFASSGLSNNVAALFEGFLVFPAPNGEAYICVRSDNQARLIIFGNVAIDNDGEDLNNRVCLRYCNNPDCLTISGSASFSLEYLENDGDAELVLEWGNDELTTFTPVGADKLEESFMPSQSVMPSVAPVVAP